MSVYCFRFWFVDLERSCNRAEIRDVVRNEYPKRQQISSSIHISDNINIIGETRQLQSEQKKLTRSVQQGFSENLKTFKRRPSRFAGSFD